MKVKLRFKKSHTYTLPAPEVTVVIEMSKVDEILSVVREKAREWKEWEET